MSSVKKLQKKLLDWYDRHQRVMPWRARQGQRPNPYHVWLSEIMLQQTTVVTVGPYFNKFISLWPTVHHLAEAKTDDVMAAWAGLGYYARARNLHKCAIAVSRDLKGKFPEDVESLRALPGIGPYTAAAVSSIAFNHPAVAVDGNVERVTSRFFGIEEPLPLSKKDIRAGATKLAKGCERPGDFTQAFMELGATVCTPRKPKCGLCPWQKECVARKAEIQEDLPRKLPKKAKPVRYGKVFWLQRRNGDFLIHKRSERGLYEGMYQLPTTSWLTDSKKAASLSLPDGLALIPFKSLKEAVRHSFTHFDLILEVWTARADKTAFRDGKWVSLDEMDVYALPTLMKKAIYLCSGDRKAKKR
jgi:A/G-specific adenine glycosylase